jgi:hypothetical protein
MTPPPLPTVRRRPASIVVAVLTIGLLVVWSVISAVLSGSGRGGANILGVFLAFVLGVALWQGTRVGWVLALALGVIRILLGGLLLVVGDDPDGGPALAAVEIVIGALLVGTLLLPGSRDYCWGEKPGL